MFYTPAAAAANNYCSYFHGNQAQPLILIKIKQF